MVAGVASSQPPIAGPPEFFQLLQTHVGVTDHDLSVTLPTGRALTLLLPVHEKGEIAVAGVERLRVPLEFFLNVFREMPSVGPTLERGQEALVFGEFSSPPREPDLQSLVLRQDDIHALPRCMPGDCSVKLSARMMDQLREQAPGTTRIEHVFRDLILQYLSQYLEQGNSVMMTYADKLPAIRSSDESRTLLHSVDWLSQAAPPLYDCLESFSGNSCRQIESFVYWFSATFGLKPVFSITHVMIYRTLRGGQPWVFIALKQVYADHYFDGSLGLAVLVEQSAGPTNPALWILYLNRSHTDALKGWLGPVERIIAKHRSSTAMQRTLLDLKDELERRYLTLAESSRR